MEPLADTSLGEPLLVLREEAVIQSSDPRRSPEENYIPSRDTTTSWIYETLLPDDAWKIRGGILLEGSFLVKLTKFLLFTFGGIFYVHWLVSHRQAHRDEQLRIWQIWVFDGGLIARDAAIFFLVGRLWQKRGIDHLVWATVVLGCNVYMELQHYVPWFRHSFTLYEMHCIWEWQTWAYFALVVVVSLAITALHVWRAWHEKVLVVKGVEVLLFIIFFLSPVLPSPYFHFHHWFAGWLVGMHFNFDVWWSTAAMAWCHGLYINGIAVYGRDPVLTCGYAYFMSWDQQCPFLECDKSFSVDSTLLVWMFGDSLPNGREDLATSVDWRNCSSA